MFITLALDTVLLSPRNHVHQKLKGNLYMHVMDRHSCGAMCI